MDGNENQCILEDNDDDETNQVEAIDLNVLVNGIGIDIEDKSLSYSLPRHHRCSAHTLNLISTTVLNYLYFYLL